MANKPCGGMRALAVSLGNELHGSEKISAAWVSTESRGLGYLDTPVVRPASDERDASAPAVGDLSLEPLKTTTLKHLVDVVVDWGEPTDCKLVGELLTQSRYDELPAPLKPKIPELGGSYSMSVVIDKQADGKLTVVKWFQLTS